MKNSLWIVVGIASLVTATKLTLSAQTPTGQGAPPATQAPAQAPAAPAPGTGRGGGGGSQKDSPINAGVDWTKQPSVLPKRPADELKEFVLPAGYHLELVLADPEITDPTAIMFDGNGRMFVLENPGYMADKEANGELDPV